MKWIVFCLLALLAIGGCSKAQLIKHDARPIASADAISIIEQVIMEQPNQFRPDDVELTDDYIALSFGSVTSSKSKGVAKALANGVVVGGEKSKGTVRAAGSRVYYNSIAGTRIQRKGNYFIVTVIGTETRRALMVYVRNQEKAFKFIDAIHSISKPM